MSDSPADTPTLEQARERFIALWGQMGANWGIPRTMAQIHALLFIAGEPMCADQIMETLDISRGSASMTLRNLCDWGIVIRAFRRGDRKEYFQAEQDVWKLFRTVLAERKKREIDPLLDSLQSCRLGGGAEERKKVDPDAATIQAHNDRLEDLMGFIQIVDSISQRFLAPTGEGLELAAKLLDRAS